MLLKKYLYFFNTQPLLWEWIWFIGTIFIVCLGRNAIKASTVSKITWFVVAVVLVGVLPLFYGNSSWGYVVCTYLKRPSSTAIYVHGCEAWAYFFERQSKIYQTWKSYPVGVLWLAFVMVAGNVHIFELWNSKILRDAWSVKRKRA